MKFASVDVEEAAGGLLAHSERTDGRTLRKGHRLTAEDVASLKAAGHLRLTVAVMEHGDIAENEAASRLGTLLETPGLWLGEASSGRANLHARTPGLFQPDRAVVDALNRTDPSMTLATLPEYSPVTAGQMVATIKIIPFAVAGNELGRATELLSTRRGMELYPYRARRVALLQTELDATKASVLDKTGAVLEARLAASSSTLVQERRCRHDVASLARLIEESEAELLIIFGASAVVDARDVVPAAIRAAGGTVRHLGMPVDPGNMLALAFRGSQTIVVAPGCARSPVKNGFDLVLDRLIADLHVGPAEIMEMGVGGLLKG